MNDLRVRYIPTYPTFNELDSDRYFKSGQLFISIIDKKEKNMLHFNEMVMMMISVALLTHTLVFFLDFHSAKVHEYTCCSTCIHYPDCEQTSISSYFLMFRAWWRGSIYQLYSLCLASTGTRTHYNQYAMKHTQICIYISFNT